MGVAMTYFKNREAVAIPKLTVLTPEQCAMIKTTWAKPDASPTDTGVVILLRFFEQYPKNQDYFSAFRNAPILSLKGTPGFCTFAGRMIEVIERAIDGLKGTDVDVEHLERIFVVVGKNHVKRHISRKSFLELRDVIHEVLCESCDLDEAQKEAWMLLLNNFFHIMFTTITAELAIAAMTPEGKS